MALHLEKQLRFYGAYHHNPVNVAIHITCVPVILWTFILLFANSPNLIPLPEYLIVKNLPPNAGTIICTVYGTLYILMEPVAGGILAPILVGGTAYANYLLSTYGSTANYWAAGANVISWIAQFIGHGVYEGRAPALLDNLFQAIFLAPLFVWIEVLFSFGYRPELQKRLEQGVQQDLAKFRQSKSNGKANGVGTPAVNQAVGNGHAEAGQ